MMNVNWKAVAVAIFGKHGVPESSKKSARTNDTAAANRESDSPIAAIFETGGHNGYIKCLPFLHKRPTM